ncbi:MAG: hypothetical protein ACRELS_00910, partial [Candidatus Rokuibacteriota bacterium]
MNMRTMFAAATFAVGLALQLTPGGHAAAQTQALPPSAGADAQGVADFRKKCEAYVALLNEIEGGLPKLPRDANAEQIDQNQQGISTGISAARASAKPGDIFVPGMVAYVRAALGQVFKRPDGKQLRASILDENPVGAAVRVNGPYP